MKTGLKLTDLATELKRQRDAKRDFVADSRKLSMTKDAAAFALPSGKAPILPFAHKQIAEKVGLPLKVYDRFRVDHPDLLAHTVNTLFEREPSQNMIRTLDGNVRAVVSNKFRALDNYDFAEAAFPALQSLGAVVESCEITETRFYIKATHPTLRRELELPANLKMGQGHNFFVRWIRAALTARNSEVGDGSLAIEDGAYEEGCTNMMTFLKAFRQSHVGRKHKVDMDIVTEIVSDTTRRLEDAVIWSKLRDRVTQAFDPENFEAMCKRLESARRDTIPKEVGVPEIAEVFAKREGLTETESKGFLDHLISGGEFSRYGMQWAATRLANDVESYERASELERLGGKIIELPRNDWQELLKAA